MSIRQRRYTAGERQQDESKKYHKHIIFQQAIQSDHCKCCKGKEQEVIKIDGWLYEKVMELNAKMDYLISKLQEAEDKAKGISKEAKK